MRVLNVDPSEEDHLEALYRPHREEGLWWFDAGDDAAFLPQLPSRFIDKADERRTRPSQGRRFLGQGQVIVSGLDTVFERWDYLAFPELVEIRLRLDEVALRIEGWTLTLEEVLGFASRLERLELGSGLLRRMTEAAGEATAAWETWLREHHPE